MENSTTIKLSDGVERKFSLSGSALRRIHSATGKNPLEKDFWTGMDPDRLCATVWGGLEATPPMTVDQVADLIDFGQIPQLMETISSLVGAKDPLAQSAPSAGSSSDSPKTSSIQ